MSSDEVLATVKTLLDCTRRLEELYPDRRFTLDGHLVGSIGEVLAAELYDLELLPGSTECHDARCPAGRNVQVKLTQARRVSMYSEPDFLIVLGLSSHDRIDEIYNGPGRVAWEVAGKPQKNGQRTVAVSKLRTLMRDVSTADQIAAVTAGAWFSRIASLDAAQGL
jgi:hypothetical protein